MTPADKLQKLIPEGVFSRWFRNATFEERAVIVPLAFQAEWIANHFDAELTQAFGFFPQIIVRKEAEAPAPLSILDVENAAATPITKARRRDNGYIARELVILNLPHSDPKAPVWVRKNGRVSLIIQGGYRSRPNSAKPEYIGIPYGSIARLILYYILTEATYTKSRRVELGQSFDAFLASIGATKESRGKKTGAEAALKQLDRLLNASFRLQYMHESEGVEVNKGRALPLADSYEIWFSKKRDFTSQTTLWNSHLELSKELFESLTKNPVPLSWDILLQLRKSPLALDLYAWLSYESARAQQSGKGRFVPWAALKEQMGAEYGTVDEFSRKARKEIRKISGIYGALKVTTPRGGVAICADSLPSVSRQELPK